MVIHGLSFWVLFTLKWEFQFFFDHNSFIAINFKVAYAKKDLHADVILDMATLTGAQGVATGRYHGAVLTNKEVWEPACMAAGKASGDLVVSTFSNFLAFLLIFQTS